MLAAACGKPASGGSGRSRRRKRPASAHAGLTCREQEIAALIGKGLSNKDIAVRLHIEVATVKNHVHHVLEKLQVRSRGQALTRLRQGANGSSPAFD